MKLTDCKPGMLVWWGDGPNAFEAEIVRVGKVRVTIKYNHRGRYWTTGWRTTSVSPKNLYPRTT